MGSSRSVLCGVIFLLATNSALADATGASIQHRNLTIQLISPDDGLDKDLRGLLLGERGAIATFLAVLAAQSNAIGDRSAEPTIEIVRKNKNFEGRILSNTPPNIRGIDRDGVFKFGGAKELVAKLCQLVGIQKCVGTTKRRLLADSIREPTGNASASVDKSDIVVRMGNFPSGSDANAFWVKNPSAQISGSFDAAPNPDVQRGSVVGAVDNIAKRAFPSPGTNLAPSLDAAPAPLPAKPKYFAVHCTAFDAPDSSMEKWVARNIKENRRNKSHGVILASGRYLPMWDFKDRRVWATKTETCHQTIGALGSVVNIEVHYFCATNRPDKATQKQYETLADIYARLKDMYGTLKIVSHREMDRGLHDGHNDPIGFEFETFYQLLKSRGINVDAADRITDQRHALRTGRDISHRWEPQLNGPLTLETARPDDCKRDH